MNANIYTAQADADFAKLHELRLARAKKAGIDVSKIPPIAEGGDYVLEDLMYRSGIPQTHGKKERELLQSGQDSSRASATCNKLQASPLRARQLPGDRR